MAFFEFFKSFVLQLENSTANYANLHILFLLHITDYIGVKPQNNFSAALPVFSLVHAQFTEPETDNSCLSREHSRLLNKVLQTTQLTDSVELTNSERQTILHILLQYYDVHICKTQNIKSLEILKMVFE